MSQTLTARQKRALDRLRSMPVPPAPEIPKGSLVQPPALFRWAPLGGLLLAAALVGLAFVRLPLAESGSQWVVSEGTQTLQLPGYKATLLLQSPADLRIERLGRRLLSGRLEGDLRLDNGELFLEADPRLPKVILLRTPLLQVRVTGTRLLIGHRPQEGTRLVVLRGKVQVRTGGNGAWNLLPVGEELTVRPDGTVLRRPLQSTFDPSHPLAFSPPGRGQGEGMPPDDSGLLRRLLWHEEE